MQFQLTLEEQEVNLVLAAIAKLPLETTLDLFMKIRTQAGQQMAAQPATASPEPAEAPSA